MERFTNVWIHLAGNPPNVQRQKPPYWRLRLADDMIERPVSTWTVTGEATQGNNAQGFEANASFLIWWELFGNMQLSESGVASIQLQPNERHTSFVSLGATQHEWIESRIRISGAPQRARRGISPRHWSTEINESGSEYGVQRWQLVGSASPSNISPGVNIENENVLHRIWLQFAGNIALDQQRNVLITLR